MFKKVRRDSRVLEGERIKEILLESEYGFLALGVQENEHGYGIPVNYVYDQYLDCFYFHGAYDGLKADMIRNNNKVSFCVVGNTELIPEIFSTYYESVISFGLIEIVDNDDEKLKALRLIIKKYSPDYELKGEEYIQKSWGRTAIYKITSLHMTAKSRAKSRQ